MEQWMSYNCPKCGVLNTTTECWNCGAVISDDGYFRYLEKERDVMITNLQRLFPKSVVILSL